MLLAIISDIHEDIFNLRKALNFIEQNRADKIICLGDIVGYSKKYFDTGHTRDAAACIDLVKEYCNISVGGNHDLAAMHKFPSESIQLNLPENWFELSEEKQFEVSGGSVWTYGDAKRNFKTDHKRFLDSLKEYEVLRLNNKSLLFSHYPFPDLSGFKSRFIGFKEELKEHFQFMQKQNCSLSFSGHRHVEGSIHAGRNHFSEHHFGKHKINPNTLWIDIPCITSGKKDSGFIFFDTLDYSLESISLKML